MIPMTFAAFAMPRPLGSRLQAAIPLRSPYAITQAIGGSIQQSTNARIPRTSAVDAWLFSG